MTMNGVRIAPSADVASDAVIGDGSSIWHLAQVREGASVGTNCSVGRGAYVGPGVSVGNNVKIQNYALVYEPARRQRRRVHRSCGGVHQRPFPPVGQRRTGHSSPAHDWEPVGVTVLEGASIGARAVCVAPVTIGRWSMVAAGATVVRDVPDFALVVGVPARRVGWVGRAGVPLEPDVDEPGHWTCPATGSTYRTSI